MGDWQLSNTSPPYPLTCLVAGLLLLKDPAPNPPSILVMKM